MRIASKQNDDDTLVDQICAGDQHAFKMLVNKHQRKVRNLVHLTLGPQQGQWVDDIAQEVFIKVYNNIDQFQKRSQFTTWLYRITINCCKDHLRKQKFNIFSFREETKVPTMSFQDKIEQSETSAIVRQAIGELPAKFRLPLILKDIEGYDYDEIARMLQCKIGTVKSRLYRARQKLKEILEPVKQEWQS